MRREGAQQASSSQKAFQKLSRRGEGGQECSCKGSTMIFWEFSYSPSYFLKRFYLFILQRGEGREKEKGRNINVWLPLMCPLSGTRPTTQACVLTGNHTGDPLICTLAPNPLSHTSQGPFLFFKIYLCIFLLKRFYLFLERGEGREEEKERNLNVWLLLTHPQPGTRPTTQACVLTRNQTHDPLVHRLALNPLSHTNQG